MQRSRIANACQPQVESLYELAIIAQCHVDDDDDDHNLGEACPRLPKACLLKNVVRNRAKE